MVSIVYPVALTFQVECVLLSRDLQFLLWLCKVILAVPFLRCGSKAPGWWVERARLEIYVLSLDVRAEETVSHSDRQGTSSPSKEYVQSTSSSQPYLWLINVIISTSSHGPLMPVLGFSPLIRA